MWRHFLVKPLWFTIGNQMRQVAIPSNDSKGDRSNLLSLCMWTFGMLICIISNFLTIEDHCNSTKQLDSSLLLKTKVVITKLHYVIDVCQKKNYTTQLKRFPANNTFWNQRRIIHAWYLVPRNELSNVMFMIRLQNASKFHVELEVPTIWDHIRYYSTCRECTTKQRCEEIRALKSTFPFYFFFSFLEGMRERWTPP